MPEHRPLSMTLDFRGDPHVVIDGTDYAMNIEGQGVTVHSLTPGPGSVAAKVTVTFMVDDLRFFSQDAKHDASVTITNHGTPDPDTSLRLPLSRGGYAGPVA